MSNLKDLLIIEDITIKKIIPGGRYETNCPKCSHRRPGKHDLVVKIDQTGQLAEWKCSNCLWADKAGRIELAEPKRVEPANKRDFTPVEAPKPGANPQSFDVFHELGITQKVLNKAKITYDVKDNVFHIPYVESGELVNLANMTLEGLVSYQKGAKPTFYGIDDAKPIPVISGNDAEDVFHIVITDSELIKLALDSLDVANVISLPYRSSASKTEEPLQAITHAAAKLEQSQKVTLAIRSGKDGDQLKAELARRIGAAKCHVLQYPPACDSLADVIRKLGGDIALDVLNCATPYPIQGIYEVIDFEETLLTYFDYGMASGVSTGWANVDALYTVMPGELTVVTGIPNHGKSEWLDALMINLAESQGYRFAIFSPEHSKEEHVTKLIEKRVHMPTSPTSEQRMSRDTFLAGASWVSHHFMFIVADDEDNLPKLEWILDRARAMVLRYGIRGLILDPWNEIEHSRPQGVSETDYISQALSVIKRFARNHDVKVWIVAHPQKQYKDPKTGLHAPPSLYDISGSAHWANKPHNGIVVHRPPGLGNVTTIYTRKVKKKHVGKNGETNLIYDIPTGTYQVPSDHDSKAVYSKGSMQPLEGDSEISVYEPD